MMNELVSIVMLSDKKAQYLIDTIRSIQAQTYENWELLSAFVFKSGSARARTSAIREAKGKWIAFIDAGDLWKPTKLEKQITFMREHDLQNTVSSTEMARMKELLYLVQIISIRH